METIGELAEWLQRHQCRIEVTPPVGGELTWCATIYPYGRGTLGGCGGDTLAAAVRNAVDQEMRHEAVRK